LPFVREEDFRLGDRLGLLRFGNLRLGLFELRLGLLELLFGLLAFDLRFGLLRFGLLAFDLRLGLLAFDLRLGLLRFELLAFDLRFGLLRFELLAFDLRFGLLRFGLLRLGDFAFDLDLDLRFGLLRLGLLVLDLDFDLRLGERGSAPARREAALRLDLRLGDLRFDFDLDLRFGLFAFDLCLGLLALDLRFGERGSAPARREAALRFEELLRFGLLRLGVGGGDIDNGLVLDSSEVGTDVSKSSSSIFVFTDESRLEVDGIDGRDKGGRLGLLPTLETSEKVSEGNLGIIILLI
jgi:hypothetical protein